MQPNKELGMKMKELKNVWQRWNHSLEMGNSKSMYTIPVYYPLGAYILNYGN